MKEVVLNQDLPDYSDESVDALDSFYTADSDGYGEMGDPTSGDGVGESSSDSSDSSGSSDGDSSGDGDGGDGGGGDGE